MRCSTLFSAVSLVAASATSSLAAQLPFHVLDELRSSSYEDYSTISTLKHPSLPAHSLRITQPKASLCERDSKARTWSGYLDVDLDKLWEHHQTHGLKMSAQEEKRMQEHPKGVTEHFYFWAFESRGDPVKDPAMLWLNGGPGCSSFTGLLMELGPCNAGPNNGSEGPHTEWNPWSWNNNATMIFLDQPIGVGYSYSSWTNQSREDPAPARIFDTPSSARDASAFLHLLSLHSKDVFSGPDGKGLPEFHMAGESYAGRYLPLTAAQVLVDNEEAIAHPERGLQPLPLKSILIGNGITSPKHQFPAYISYACDNNHGFGTFLSEEQCASMKADLPTCLTLTEKCNSTPDPRAEYDVLACKLALQYCEGKLSTPWYETGRSAYDWRHMGDYEEEEWVGAFLNANSTKKALGVDARTGDKHDGNFIGCSDAVGKHFEKTGDGARDSSWAVKEILEKGTRVLAYSGASDWICNLEGNNAWTLDLEWSGKEGFNKAPLEDWYEDRWATESSSEGEGKGKFETRRAGQFRHFGNLTFAIADESGHFVPHDQPAAALSMVNYWLHSDKEGRLEW